MDNVIKEKLKEIEASENVKILHCIESGSRAWGFASPDSDYDVRFIYKRPLEHYLRLDKYRDVIEWQLDDTLDINGWDIQKALRLLHNSNPTVFEWNSSPIIYHTTAEWEKVSSVIDSYFIEKSVLYHYLSVAKSNFYDFLTGETVKLKKYFYTLRPILACKWILAEGTPPPMLFSELTGKYLDVAIKQDVEKLLELKIKTPELGICKRVDNLTDYITANITEIGNILNNMPPQKSQPWEKTNSLFLSLILP